MNLQITIEELEKLNEFGFIERPVNVESFKQLILYPEMVSRFVIKKDLDEVTDEDVNEMVKRSSARLLIAYREFEGILNENQITIYTDVNIIISEDLKNFVVYAK